MMSFPRSAPSKTHGNSTNISSLPTLPKAPPRLPIKRPIVQPKTETKLELSSLPDQNELDDIINNLSTIVQRSEKVLTPKKSSNVTTTTVRRTSSLHINNRDHLSSSFVKTSNSHHDKLTDSNLDLSRLNTQRRSLRNLEKFSGIKCSLPSGKSMLPNNCKTFDKTYTPVKKQQMNISSSFIDNQITPTGKSEKVKSPWRLRFEKFVNHQELTPLSPPSNESIAFTTAKTSSSNKENRTPSFRLPARRNNKIHLISKKDKN